MVKRGKSHRLDECRYNELKILYCHFRNSEVEVQVDESLVASTIVGVDDCGFLLARRHDNGDVMSLQPDGNTFDITRNLIAAKR